MLEDTTTPVPVLLTAYFKLCTSCRARHGHIVFSDKTKGPCVYTIRRGLVTLNELKVQKQLQDELCNALAEEIKNSGMLPE